MAAESGARASSTLSGTLQERALAALLAGACERGTSGTFAFRHRGRRDSLTMHRGRIAVVRTTMPVAYLGGILYELGHIDARTLDATLQEVARARRLHGDVLTELGITTPTQIDHALAEQTFRNVQHLFSLPDEATWSFREDIDELAGARDEGRPPIETWQAIWRGLRAHEPTAHVGLHVRLALAKLAAGTIHLTDLRNIDRLGLAPAERALCNQLHQRPSTLAPLLNSSPLAPGRTELLVYVLSLARAITRVDAQPLSPLDLGIHGIRDRARRIDDEDPHTMLGLRPGASHEAARAAYFRLARLWHPERIPTSLHAVRPECEHVFARLGDAHRILTDIAARKRAADMVTGATIDASVAGNASSAHNGNHDDSPRVVRTATMRDVDAALARNDLDVAEKLARSLANTGADGPGARAVLALCTIRPARSADPVALDPAIAALDKILTGDPDCVRALFYRGQLLERLGRSDPALRDFRKVARLDPRHIEAHRELRLHEMRRRPEGRSERSPPPQAPPQPPAALAPPHTPLASPASPSTPHTPDCRAGESTGEPTESGLRSGLRRLLARVAGR